jgi:uncharacterized SAM-binding protein YcdF (DUF218 family)
MKCVIVLGGGLAKGLLNQQSKLRYDKTFRIHKKYDIILCSSGHSYRNPQSKESEAKVGQNYLISLGVPKAKIMVEGKSSDTFSNAYYCRKIIDKFHIKSFSVVTSSFHMKKTKFVFKFVFPTYKIKFIKSQNGISRNELKNRKISESLIVKFYKKNLAKTYKVKKGDMKSISWFLRNKNLATSGKMDSQQKELTDKIKQKMDKRSPLKY